MKPTRAWGINCRIEIQHAQSGAQDGDKDNFTFQLETGRGREWRADGNIFYRKIARRLVNHQRGNFAEEPPEFLRLRPPVAQPGEVVLHERVRDDGDAVHDDA